MLRVQNFVLECYFVFVLIHNHFYSAQPQIWAVFGPVMQNTKKEKKVVPVTFVISQKNANFTIWVPKKRYPKMYIFLALN